MIQRAERDGKLKPGYTIIEASTGNTGIALSLVGGLLGYKVSIYMPTGMTAERIRIMESYGAEVEQLEIQEPQNQDKSVAGAEVEISTRQTCLDLERRSRGVWWARQFSNPANVDAHVKTGKEILKQMDYRVDAFCASVGTGGTLLGIARALKEEVPDVKIVAVEPASSRYSLALGHGRVPGANDEVTGGIVSELLANRILDDVIQVTNDDAVLMSDRLVREEGLFVGVSAGANVLAATRLAHKLGPDRRVATILPDSRDRYLTEKRYTT